MSADTAILGTCLEKMWVITHETPLQTSANLGQTPSVWHGGKNCIGNRQTKGLRRKNMVKDLKKLAQTEFDALIARVKEENPNLYLFLVDFVNKKVSIEEVEAFLKMEHETQQLYIKNYKARS